MGKTEFVKGRDLWPRIKRLVGESKQSWAAIAYLGKNGHKLLPLKEGDTLVVDMSRSAVRQGVTDPREVQKYMNAGVLVASRSDLHAKVVVADGVLITGSMNASMNSANWLAEAALITSDAAAAAAARHTIKRWAAEPILPLQLAEALKDYRPPQFKAAKTIPRQRGRPAIAGPRLWVVGGLVYGDVPRSEAHVADGAEKAAVHGRRLRNGTSRMRLNFAFASRFTKTARPGDWVVSLVEGRVEAPARVMATTSYPRGRGLRRHLVIIEERDEIPTRPLAAFRRAAMRAAGLKLSNRTRLLTGHQAEAVLNCWSQKTWMPLEKFFKARRS